MSSWIDIPPGSHFPVQSLPWGAFVGPDGDEHCGVAVGEHVLDLKLLYDAGLIPLPFQAFDGNLTDFAALGRPAWQSTRAAVRRLVTGEDARLRDDAKLRERAVLRQEDVTMTMPVTVGDYTDFYSSREHATNVGAMFRPDQPLMPNWLHLPIAYHGRSSSVVISGTPVIRPCGQYRPDPQAPPVFGPTRSLDFELEVAAVIGPPNAMGEPIPIGEAESHIFGLVLLNDWSARDIQAWEYQPLGPFLGKNFATTISPWVVPLEALEPWRCPGPTQGPEPLPYLRHEGPGAFDIRLEVHLNGATISISNFKHLYWSLRQQVAHHTVNGCPLRPGDLLASGTISGPTPDSLGSMLEITRRGANPLALPGGATRKFLEDGDQVVLTGWCQGDGYRVGFGEAAGVILPARR
jgi:fumarylacetoacetase